MAQQNEIGLIQFIKKSREKICLNMKIIKKNIKSRQNKNYLIHIIYIQILLMIVIQLFLIEVV